MEKHSTARGKEDNFWGNYYKSKPAPGGVMITESGEVIYGEKVEGTKKNKDDK